MVWIIIFQFFSGSDKDDEDADKIDEELMDEEDEELDEGTDYANNFFDNGENYLDDDEDNLDEGGIYWRINFPSNGRVLKFRFSIKF